MHYVKFIYFRKELDTNDEDAIADKAIVLLRE